MSVPKLNQAFEDRFDDSIDDATHAVITCFEWMGLPEASQLSDLMVEINQAITQTMAPWK